MSIKDSRRKRIEEILRSIGINPENAVHKFDKNLKTEAEKQQAVEQTQKFAAREWRKRIIDGLVFQEWNPDEVDWYLIPFGIEKGLNSATDAQLEQIHRDMLRSRMIPPKKDSP